MRYRLLATCACLFALAACTESPQDSASAPKSHTPAWEGTKNPYEAPGWKPGDREAWEAQLEKRARGQDEYKRIGGTS